MAWGDASPQVGLVPYCGTRFPGRTSSRTAQLLLSVLTIEPDVRFLAEETLRRHQLGAKTTVQRTLRGLVERELLVVRPQRGGYAFDDPFFRRWIELEAVRT